jgi:alkylation response protein AidB-like acyl-CoA dehydrogenase
VLFDLSEEQATFRAIVKDFLRRQFPTARLRAVWDGAELGHEKLWRELADLGVLGVAVPEHLGGMGGSQVELALALEETGYAALPLPVLETAAVVAPLLAEFAASAAADEWVPRLAAGQALASLCLDSSGLVTWGHEADVVLVARGDELHLVPAAMIAFELRDSQDVTRRLASADTARLGPATLVTRDRAAVARAHDLACAGTANALVGVSQRLLDMSVDYSLQRQQFGHVIGSFQTLKHRMADIAVAIEAARGLSWYAAYALSHEPHNASAAARAAKASAAAAGYAAGHGALQIHGGIGFTWEHDLHLWLQRGRALEASYGNGSDHRLALGRAVLAELTTH